MTLYNELSLQRESDHVWDWVGTITQVIDDRKKDTSTVKTSYPVNPIRTAPPEQCTR